MPTLSPRHHTLIQALLSRGPLSEKDFLSLFSQVTGKTSAQQKQQLFNDYVRKINQELNYVQFDLRLCRDQYDGTVYYGIVNTVSDEQSKLGTKYSVPQIAFYKGIVEAITHDAEAKGSISNTDALYVRLDMQVQGASDSQSQAGTSQVPPAFKNFSMSHKEKTLEQLVKDQWLCSTPDGSIGLGIRSFLDLRNWFRTNEVPVCKLCDEAAIKAELCQNESCDVRLHQFCLKQSKEKGTKRTCPSCDTQWQGSSSVKAEDVEKEDDPTPTQNTRSSGKKRLRSRQEANPETSGSDPLQTSPIPDAKRVTRRSTRPRG